MGESFFSAPLSEQSQILINRSTAHAADAGKLAEVELPRLISWIVAIKDGRDVVGSRLRPTNSLALGFCVGHAGTHSGPDHGKLQLSEDTGHLQKCLGHRIGVTAPAVHGNATYNDQAKRLALDNINDFTQLFGTPG